MGLGSAGKHIRVLAVVARYLDRHTDYLLALAEHVELTVAVSGEEMPGSAPAICMVERGEGPPMVASYGRRGALKVRAVSDYDPEMVERLKSLGYLN